MDGVEMDSVRYLGLFDEGLPQKHSSFWTFKLGCVALVDTNSFHLTKGENTGCFSSNQVSEETQKDGKKDATLGKKQDKNHRHHKKQDNIHKEEPATMGTLRDRRFIESVQDNITSPLVTTGISHYPIRGPAAAGLAVGIVTYLFSLITLFYLIRKHLRRSQ
eukprot:TRINITY_DN2158_c0_g1_i12.p1 TRINITY_DN2158_c0_g1~~TRINITY_DN2158_c0_g1_i12.p1  ORF type:complete len:162 (+),score=24.31 TRINITY_DN2158_c0_g1_i12:817-1302(+)